MHGMKTLSEEDDASTAHIQDLICRHFVFEAPTLALCMRKIRAQLILTLALGLAIVIVSGR